MKEILQTKYLNLKSTLFVHLLIFLHIPALYMQNTLIRNRQLLKKKQQPRTRRIRKSCKSWRLSIPLKSKTPLTQLTPTSSQASTGSIYPVLKFKFKIMQAPVHLPQSLTIVLSLVQASKALTSVLHKSKFQYYLIYLCI